MNSALREGYHDGRRELWSIFDVCDPDGAESLHLQRAALGEDGDLEFLDQDHAVLIDRSGGFGGLMV